MRTRKLPRLAHESLERRNLLTAVFSLQQSIATEIETAPTTVLTADVVGGGSPELIAVVENDFHVISLDATIPQAPHAAGSAAARLTDVQAADVNNDSHDDLLAIAANEVLLFRSRGDGTFDEAEVLVANTPGLRELAVVDLNGDGDLDLLLGNRNTDSVTYYENNANTFTVHSVLIDDIDEVNSISVADVDGNGTMDVLASGSNGNSARSDVYLVFQSENGFGPPTRVAGGAGVFGATLFAAHEDGLINDVVFRSIWRDSIQVHRNIDSDEITDQEFAIRNSALRFTAADIDGDSLVDVQTSFSGEPIRFYRNDGNGRFSTNQMQNSIETTGAVHATNLDDDARAEIIAANTTDAGTTFNVYEYRIVGDVNDDGLFDSRDLISVFQHRKYEDEFEDNSTFNEGDWNNDSDFSSSDLVDAFACGHYVRSAAPLGDPASVDAVFAHAPASRFQPTANRLFEI